MTIRQTGDTVTIEIPQTIRPVKERNHEALESRLAINPGGFLEKRLLKRHRMIETS